MNFHHGEFISDMYFNYLGWDLPTRVDYFNVPTGGFMFTNVTFWEQVILVVFLLIWGIMKLIFSKSAMMKKGYHLFKSLFLVLFISFMFPLIFFGALFWRQHYDLPDGTGKFFGYYF